MGDLNEVRRDDVLLSLFLIERSEVGNDYFISVFE